jgi:cytosine permease
VAESAVQQLDELYEFDRQPVSDDRLLGLGYFIGSFSGEHVAATEFVIGANFVNWGATVEDVFVGLLIGNLMAVLTWALLCAPVAVDTRLTLYWYLRGIAGPAFTLVYDVLNAVLFCILAGAMVTVSASAVRIPFGIAPQVNWYPDDLRFVVVVLGVGGVVTALAILGFKKLASFATVCSPWMLLMFVSGAFVMLPEIGRASGVGAIDSVGSFFEAARLSIWTGVTPDGSEPMGFWKIAAFAWICNLAMHGGLSDMALFRYAKKSSYGLASVFGMFLGHYMAWICAGVMGAGAAVVLNRGLTTLDSGEVAYQALGWAGIVAVVIAGWTTSNPTLYRAGLALQAVTPNWSRARVTLVAGALTTVIACFPFVFTRLLDFIGIYGLLLAPPGAIVLTEHYIFPRIGLQRYWVHRRQMRLSWPAVITWGASIALALGLERSGTLHLFYLFLPTYLFASVVYIVLAKMAGAGAHAGEEEPLDYTDGGPHAAAPKPRGSGKANALAGVVALVALITSVGMPFGVWMEWTTLETVRQWLIVPTLVYFVAGAVFYSSWRRNTDPAG